MMSDKCSHPQMVHISLDLETEKWTIILKISLICDISRLRWSPCIRGEPLTTKFGLDTENKTPHMH